MGGAVAPHDDLHVVHYPSQTERGGMATYEMNCTQCKHSFEVFRQGFLRDKDKVCPECGSVDVRQKFSSFLRNFGNSGSSGCGPQIGGFG